MTLTSIHVSISYKAEHRPLEDVSTSIQGLSPHLRPGGGQVVLHGIEVADELHLFIRRAQTGVLLTQPGGERLHLY